MGARPRNVGRVGGAAGRVTPRAGAAAGSFDGPRLDAELVRERGAGRPARLEDWVPAADGDAARSQVRDLHVFP